MTALDATEDHVATVSTDGLLRVWASVKGVLLWETVVAARGSAARTSVEFFGAGLVRCAPRPAPSLGPWSRRAHLRPRRALRRSLWSPTALLRQ